MHQLAALLFQLEIHMHKGGLRDIERVTQHEDPPIRPGFPRFPARVSLFSHHAYTDHEIFPEGVADVVGYWAEDRILGGVAVFDRPAEGNTPLQPPNVYFYSCRNRVTLRYYQLRDEQQQSMVDFFLAEDPHKATCPLPMLADANNRVRVDAHVAVLRRRIYRDVWERRPPTAENVRWCEGRPKDEIDHPENREILLNINRRLGASPLPSVSRPRVESPSRCQSPGQNSGQTERGGKKNSGNDGKTRGRSPPNGKKQ
jgi:hypothetical protein